MKSGASIVVPPVPRTLAGFCDPLNPYEWETLEAIVRDYARRAILASEMRRAGDDRPESAQRALQIADTAAQEVVMTEGEPTSAPDEYRIPQCQADEHVRSCIDHLVWRGLAISAETPDGYIVVQLLEDA